MTIVIALTLGLLGVAGLLCVLRLLRPSTLADRTVAVDTLLWIIAAALGVYILEGGGDPFRDLVIVVSLLGFTGTVVVARFIERRGT